MIAVNPVAVVRDLLSHRLEVTSIRSLGGLSVVGLRGTIPAPRYLLAEQAFQRGLLSIEEIGGGDVHEVLAFVREGLGAEFSLHPSVGLGDDVALASPSVVGGALVAGDRVIHMSLFRGAEYGRGRPRNRSGQIARPRDRQRHFHSAG